MQPWGWFRERKAMEDTASPAGNPGPARRKAQKSGITDLVKVL